MNLTFRLQNPTAKAIDLKDFQWGWGPGIGTADAERKENNRLIRALSMGKLKAHVMKPGDYSEFGQWVGIDNRYFLVAFLPDYGRSADIECDGDEGTDHRDRASAAIDSARTAK